MALRIQHWFFDQLIKKRLTQVFEEEQAIKRK